MGKLIVFEGIDGSGKSTQFQLMCDRFSREGRAFMNLRFPRYEKPSAALLKMYLDGEFGNDPDSVNAYAASSFYAVDRIASFIQDWREYYEGGGLIMTDRYTTSNAIHQGAKLTADKREVFFRWLYEYEFSLLGLPAPDVVIYLDIDAPRASRRLNDRQAETDTVGDIHEKDLLYLEQCTQCGGQAAMLFDWRVIKCCREGNERGVDDIPQEIYQVIMSYELF